MSITGIDIKKIKPQLLADVWDGVAPFGLTSDGEIAPALALDEFGDDTEACTWTLNEFYNARGQCMGTIPRHDGFCS